MSVLEHCDVGRVPDVFKGLISLLKFYRTSGHLYMVDRFANTINAQDALNIVREMLSLVSRLTPSTDPSGRRICVSEEVTSERDAEWYRHLGAAIEKVEEKKWRISIPCPYLPSDEELKKFSECISKGLLKPSAIAVYAYVPHER